MYINTATMTIW